jgi:hypothetical protein
MVRTMLDVVSGHMGLYMSIFINVHSETLTKFLAHGLQGFRVTKMLLWDITVFTTIPYKLVAIHIAFATSAAQP